MLRNNDEGLESLEFPIYFYIYIYNCGNLVRFNLNRPTSLRAPTSLQWSVESGKYMEMWRWHSHAPPEMVRIEGFGRLKTNVKLISRYPGILWNDVKSMRAASANPLAIERISLGKLKTSHQPDPSHPILKQSDSSVYFPKENPKISQSLVLTSQVTEPHQTGRYSHSRSNSDCCVPSLPSKQHISSWRLCEACRASPTSPDHPLPSREVPLGTTENKDWFKENCVLIS